MAIVDPRHFEVRDNLQTSTDSDAHFSPWHNGSMVVVVSPHVATSKVRRGRDVSVTCLLVSNGRRLDTLVVPHREIFIDIDFDSVVEMQVPPARFS